MDSIVENDFSFHVFASFSTIKLIEEKIITNRHYLMDGTFKIRPYPSHFSQVLIISIEYMNNVSETKTYFKK